MAVFAWGILALGMTLIALTNGIVPVSFTTGTSSVDVGKKGVRVDAGVMLFSVFTNNTATILFSTKRDTVLKLVINDDVSPSEWRTVLYHVDKKTNTYESVMVLQQTQNLCENSHWFVVTFTTHRFLVADYCNRKKSTFSWKGYNTKEPITTVYVHTQGRANWVFARDKKVKCKTAKGKVFKEFLRLQGVTHTQSIPLHAWTIHRSLYESKRFQVTYKSCQEAFLVFSHHEVVKNEYFLLFLNHVDNKGGSVSSMLFKRHDHNLRIGSSLKTEDSCHDARTLHVYWSKKHIGVGLHCDQSSGIEWKIDSKDALLFVATTTKGHGSTKWNVSTDSCDVRYNPEKLMTAISQGKDSSNSSYKSTNTPQTSTMKGLTSTPSTNHTSSMTDDSLESLPTPLVLTSSRPKTTILPTTWKNLESPSENPPTVTGTSTDRNENKDVSTSDSRNAGRQMKFGIHVHVLKVMLLYFVLS